MFLNLQYLTLFNFLGHNLSNFLFQFVWFQFVQRSLSQIWFGHESLRKSTIGPSLYYTKADFMNVKGILKAVILLQIENCEAQKNTSAVEVWWLRWQDRQSRKKWEKLRNIFSYFWLVAFEPMRSTSNYLPYCCEYML